LAQLGILTGALAVEPGELRAASAATRSSSWDTSWIEALATSQYRVVFNANEIADGWVMVFARQFLDDYHEVHHTADSATRAAIVFRRLGVPMAFNDAIWERYRIGEDVTITDPDTGRAATRNVFWNAKRGASPDDLAFQLETLRERGVISLVCNIAIGKWSEHAASRLRLDAHKVRADVAANLIPGAIVVPSGIFALIRAQNAGCAYMPGA
jgi:intracellular sulfur oxidation DsrE/DsrF family protein